MKKLILGLSLLLLVMFVFKNTSTDSPQAKFKRQKIHVSYVVQNSVSRKSSALAKASIKKNQTHQLSELEIEAINLKDDKVVGLKLLEFPQSDKVTRKQLDDDSYAVSFKTASGDERNDVYNNNQLTGEVWQNSKGRKIIRNYDNGRLFAISEENGSESTTLFYDSHNMIAKRIDVNGKQRVCYKYDSGGNPSMKSSGECKDDDYRELDDIRD